MSEARSAAQLAERAAEMIGRPRPTAPPAPAHQPDPDVEAWRAQALAAHRAERWAATVPPRMRAASMTDLGDDARGPIERWHGVRGTGANLLLVGPVGAGKTWSACAAVRPIAESGADVLFKPLVELMDDLRPGGPDGVWDHAVAVDVLVLDDLGTERPTEWTAERLFALVNRRWLEQRPIVATTNLGPEPLSAALGERTYSRLVGGAVIIRLAGDDRRRTTRTTA